MVYTGIHQGHMLVSVIISTLNEERCLANTLQFIAAAPHTEIIVVDGGSTDKTVEIARRFTEYVFLTHPGRAHQMNFGARHATGDVLLFLHADTMLLPGALDMVRYQMRRVNIVGGAFDLHLDSEHRVIRFIARMTSLRARALRTPYGDQAIFIRSKIFHHLLGYRDMPLMEDLDLARRMRRLGRIVFIADGLVSSARRWDENGAFKTTAIYTLLRLLFLFGVKPRVLAGLHRKYFKQPAPSVAPEPRPEQKITPQAG